MLAFAIDYRAALDDITGDRTMQLRDYELSQDEWAIAEQLRDLLKVSIDHLSMLHSSGRH